MNKRTISLLMSVVMILSMLVSAVPVYAVSNNGLDISATQGSAEGVFTVTLNIPSVTNVLENTQFKITFDNTVFEVTEAPVYIGITGGTATMPTAAEVNSNGYYTLNLLGTDIVIGANAVLKAQFKVKKDATPDSYDFKLTEAAVSYTDESLGLPIYPLQLKDFEITTVTYTVQNVVSSYTVSFDANGGTGTMDDVTDVSGDYTLPANGFTAPAGQQFKGWSVEGAEKAVGEIITVTKDTVVIAVWEEVHTHDWADEYSKDETHHWYECSGCDEVKDKAEHDWDDGVETTPATETTPGVMTYTCDCGQTKTEEIPVLDHTHDWADEYSKDETHHWYECSGCDEVKDKAEHDWDDGVETTPATETTPGVMTYTCDCGQTKTEEIPVLDHTHDWADEYSKDETHHWYECSGCDEVKDKAEHDWDDGVETTPATETTPGVMTYTCDCGQTKTEEIPVLEHTHNWADEYSKDETHHWYDCSGCDEIKNKAEHDWDDGVETTPATETTPGVMTYTCDCGQTKTEEIPVLDHTHDWADEYSKDETHHWYDCSGCDEVKDKAEHDWDDGVETTPATETTPGVMTYTCDCGQTKTEEIPVLDHTHDWADEYSKDETHHWYECSGCDEVKDKAEHDWGDGVETTPATETTPGVMTYTCDCGQTKTEETPVLEHTHNWADEYSKDETHHWYDCSGCDEVKDKAKHIESNWIIDREPTTKTEGHKHTECVVCGYVMDTDSIPVVDSGFDYDWWYMMQILMNQKFTITAEAEDGGSITPNGKTQVLYNRSQKYVITPDEGYEIEAVYVNGKNVGAVSEYTFKGVKANQTIEATFVKTGWDNPFIDIFESDTYYDAIEYVYVNGLFKGMSDIEFAPETTMTRAMFVTVLGRLAGIDADDYTEVNFDDVEAGTWYAPYVAWASEEGLVLGYGNGLFGTEDEITVEQAVVLLARFADYIGIDIDTDAALDSFFDADEVADWAVEQMKWAVDNDIYEGINGELNPKAPAKRWMLAEMLLAFGENYGE